MRQNKLFIKRLLSGAASDMAVDGSGVAQTFSLVPVAGEIMHVARLIFFVQDTGSFDAAKWGNGITMANGLALESLQDGDINTMLPIAIKSSGDLGGICYDIANHAWGAGDEIMVARLSFDKLGGAVRLVGDNGDTLSITVADDLTGLTTMCVTAEGYYEGQDY